MPATKVLVAKIQSDLLGRKASKGLVSSMGLSHIQIEQFPHSFLDDD